MNYVTIDQVNAHLARLDAEVQLARLAREAHPAHRGHNAVVELVSSVVTSIRVALEPTFPVFGSARD
jgi:hypothetical protein